MIKIADINIDNVNIEIQSSSEKASSGVNQLIETLNHLNSTLNITQQNTNKYTQVMNRISNLGKNIKMPSISSNIKNLNVSKELEVLNSNIPTQPIKNNNIKEAVQQTDDLKSRFQSLGSIVGKIGSRIASMFKSIGKATILQLGIKGLSSAFGNLGNKLSSIRERLKSTLKTFSRYSLALFGIRSSFYAVRNTANEFLSSQNAIAKQLSANISYLKYTIGASLAPVITFLTNLIYSLLRALQYLVYYFAKINIFSNASAENMSSAAGSAGKTTKELQKQLQAFDELNNISLESSSGSGGGGGAGDISPNFDLSEIDEKFKYLFDDIDNWGKKLAEKINNALARIDWDSILQGAENVAKRLANILNDFTYYLNFNLLGETIAQGLNTAITFIDTFFQEYDWGLLGKQLAIGLNSIVDTLQWDRLGKFLTDGFRSVILTLEGFVTTFEWKDLGTKLSIMFTNAFKNIPWKNLANTLNVGITGALDTLIEFLDKVDWNEVGKKIGEFLNDINWTEILGKVFQAIGALGKSLVETLWSTMFSGSDTTILGILSIAFVAVKSGLLKTLIPSLETIVPAAKTSINKFLGNIFRVTVGLLLIFESLKTSFDKITNQAKNGLSLKNLAKNLGGGLEAGVGTLLLTKNVKLSLLVGVGKVSFDTGLDLGAELNKLDWFQEEYDLYIEQFNISAEDNDIIRNLKGIAGVINVIEDAFLSLMFVTDFGKLRRESSAFVSDIINFIKKIPEALSDVAEFIKKWWNEKVAPWFTKEKWIELGKNAKKGIEEKFNEWKNFQPIRDWWNDKVAPWFTKEKWIEVANNAKIGIENKFNEWKNNFQPIRDWWNNKVVPWFTVAKWRNITNNAKVGIENKFNEWKNGFQPIRDWWNNKVAPWFTVAKWKELANKGVEGIRRAFSNLTIRIKLPHFSWSTQPTSGTIAKILSTLNLPTSLPKLNISWYAGGGYPTEGDLFFANEAGPEMVGTIGNKNAVANNDQITKAIADATYRAISQALNENQDNGQPIIVNVGNETLYKEMTRSRSQASNQYGIAI